MNLKKILILPVGFILIHVLYIGCCKCLEGDYYRDVSSLRATHSSRLFNTSQDSVYIPDTLFTFLQINFNYITQTQKNPFGQLVNSAYATSCNCNTGDLGYKFPMDSVVIISNKTFNTIPAGTNIASMFKGVYTYGLSGVPQYLPITQLLDSVNKYRTFANLNLINAQLPGAEKIHTLKYILYSNGKQYEATAKKVVVWQ